MAYGPIVPSEWRATFERTLQERLRVSLAGQPRLVVRRNEVRVLASSSTDVAGTLALDHLTKSQSYALVAYAAEPAALRDLRHAASPPYASRLLTEYAMAFTSSGERSRTFAPTAGGAVGVPRDAVGVTSTCDWIAERLIDIFIPRVLDLVDLRPGVVANVAENPDDYAWPVLTAVAAMRKHGMTRAEVDLGRLLGRKVSRNRAFDAALLASADRAAGGPM